MEQRHAQRLANATFVLGRRLRELVPARIRKAVDDRFFYAVHQMTRVTNDDYVSDEVRKRRRKG